MIVDDASNASGDDLVALYSVYLKPSGRGASAREAEGTKAARSSTDSSSSELCTALYRRSNNIHGVANYEIERDQKKGTAGDREMRRRGETDERKGQEERDEEDEVEEELRGMLRPKNGTAEGRTRKRAEGERKSSEWKSDGRWRSWPTRRWPEE